MKYKCDTCEFKKEKEMKYKCDTCVYLVVDGCFEGICKEHCAMGRWRNNPEDSGFWEQLGEFPESDPWGNCQYYKKEE